MTEVLLRIAMGYC